MNVQSHISFLPHLTHWTDPLPEQQICPVRLRNIWGISGNVVLPLVGRPGIGDMTAHHVLETADDKGQAGTERPGRELDIRPSPKRF